MELHCVIANVLLHVRHTSFDISIFHGQFYMRIQHVSLITVCTYMQNNISGLVVEYIGAIDVARSDSRLMHDSYCPPWLFLLSPVLL